MNFYLSRIHFPITTLGYGKRIGIWFQGCSIRCPGCISIDTWAFNKGETNLNDVWKTIVDWCSIADGVTISGGEPFDQPGALEEILTRLRARLRGDILVFSGHPWEKLEPWFAEHDGLVDVLVSDPYSPEAPQTLTLRGSDNQRMHLLTPLGKNRYEGWQRGHRSAADDVLDVCFGEDGDVWLAGIPRKGTMEKLKNNLNQQGFSCSTSAAPLHKHE